MLGGGTVFNAIPREAWFTVICALSTPRRKQAGYRCSRCGEQAADKEGVGFRMEEKVWVTTPRRAHRATPEPTCGADCARRWNFFRKSGSPNTTADRCSTDDYKTVAMGILPWPWEPLSTISRTGWKSSPTRARWRPHQIAGRTCRLSHDTLTGARVDGRTDRRSPTYRYSIFTFVGRGDGERRASAIYFSAQPRPWFSVGLIAVVSQRKCAIHVADAGMHVQVGGKV